MNAFTESMALELSRFGVRARTVLAGPGTSIPRSARMLRPGWA